MKHAYIFCYTEAHVYSFTKIWAGSTTNHLPFTHVCWWGCPGYCCNLLSSVSYDVKDLYINTFEKNSQILSRCGNVQKKIFMILRTANLSKTGS